MTTVKITCPVCGNSPIEYDIVARDSGHAMLSNFKQECLCMAFGLAEYTALIDGGRELGGVFPMEPGHSAWEQRRLARLEQEYLAATQVPFAPDEAEILGGWVQHTVEHGAGDPEFMHGVVPESEEVAGFKALATRGFLIKGEASYELTDLARRWIRDQLYATNSR